VTRPPAPGRKLLACGLGALTILVASVNWRNAVVAAAVLLVMGRTWGLVAESVRLRRAKRGPRPTDRARAAAQSPFRFLLAIIEMIPSGGIGGLLGWVTYLAMIEVINFATDAGATPTIKALCVAAAVAFGLGFTWWGPASDLTRYGTLTALHALTRTPRTAVIVALLLVAALAYVAAGWLVTGETAGGWRQPWG
jgi:hypothetical protein